MINLLIWSSLFLRQAQWAFHPKEHMQQKLKAHPKTIIIVNTNTNTVITQTHTKKKNMYNKTTPIKKKLI